MSTRVLFDTASNSHGGYFTDSGFFPDKTAWSVGFGGRVAGPERGVEIVTMSCGDMAVTVCPTRGMNVVEARYKGVRVGWDSPVTSMTHPCHLELSSHGGYGWLHGFSDFLIRCGLSYVGHPVQNPDPAGSGPALQGLSGLHGEIGFTPASRASVSMDGEKGTLTLQGDVYETMFRGINLALRVSYTLRAGDDVLVVADGIENRSAREAECQLLYHFNIGSPVLSPRSRIAHSFGGFSARDAHSRGGLPGVTEIRGPGSESEEQVFFSVPAGRNGEETVALNNPSPEVSLRMRYDARTLPCFTLWKNLYAGEDGYVIGFEPGTSYPNAYTDERAAGRIMRLLPGETKETRIDISLSRKPFNGEKNG